MRDVRYMYEQIEENINNKLLMVDELIHSENKDLDTAKNELLLLLKDEELYKSNELIKYHNFENKLAYLIYRNMPNNSNIKMLEVNFYSIYSRLAYIYVEEKNFDKAIEAIEKIKEWNPMTLSPYFEYCEILKLKEDFEQFHKENLKLYDKIYFTNDLARYYRNMGYYYIEKEQFDVAYALYRLSLIFNYSKSALNELKYINVKTKFQYKEMSVDDLFKLLEENNISIGIKQENISNLIYIYKNNLCDIEYTNDHKLLLELLYLYTKNPEFIPIGKVTFTYKGFEFKIPAYWKFIEKSYIKNQYGMNGLFGAFTEDKALFHIEHYEGSKSFDDDSNNYFFLRPDVVSESDYKVLKKDKLNFKINNNDTLLDYVIYENDNNRYIKVGIKLNNKFTTFTIDLDKNIEIDDTNNFTKQKNYFYLNKIIESLNEFEPEKLPEIDKKNIKNSEKNTNPHIERLNNLINKMENELK